MTSLSGHLAHLAPRQREEIIRRVESGQESMRKIAASMGVAPSTVSRTIHHYYETGEIVEHPSGGPHPAYDDDDLYHLDCLIDQHPSATAATLHRLMGSSAPPVDVRTIESYRHALDYTRRKPAVWVIDTERTAALRAAWVTEHKEEDHSRWVYMDESTLCLRHTGDWVWVKRGQPTPRHEIAGLKCHVNVWGAAWNDGAVFCFYTGYLNSSSYTDILDTHLSRHKRHLRHRTFISDGVGFHGTEEVQRWFM
jgi:transposase